MKTKFLLLTGILTLSLVLVSMTMSPIIDEVAVYDSGALTTSTYYVEQGTLMGGVTLYGTRDQEPVPNNDGGMNYHCIKSEDICYHCNNCTIVN